MRVATALSASACRRRIFIVRGADRRWPVVDHRPVEEDMAIVGPSGVTHRSRAEAMSALKAVKVCEKSLAQKRKRPPSGWRAEGV
jgi:mannose-6-phosphate isomerase-like protein (cupin superfamily)